MATIEDLLNGTTEDTSPEEESENLMKILSFLKSKQATAKVLVKIIAFISRKLKSDCQLAWDVWNFIIRNYYETGTRTREYFKTFICNESMGDEEEVLQYNLNIAYVVLENIGDDDKFIMSQILQSARNRMKFLASALQRCPVVDLYWNFVNFRLMPHLFSMSFSLSERTDMMSVVLNTGMGVFLEKVPAEAKVKLKQKIMNVYLPAIAPDKEIPRWWEYCVLLIHYCGKFLHNEIELTNAILRRVEFGFKAKNVDSRAGSYECWQALIKNYNLDPKYLRSPKQISLLLKPLKARLSRSSTVSLKRFDAFCNFITHLGNSSVLCIEEFMNFCFGPFGGDYKRPCDLVNQYFPGRLTSDIFPRCLHSLLRLIGHECPEECYKMIHWQPGLNVKTFLFSWNLNKHHKIFFDSITICSLLISEWIQDEKPIYVKCVWTTMFSIMQKCENVSPDVYQNIIVNIKMVTKAILTYDMFYYTLNEIIKIIDNYLKESNYDAVRFKELVVPLVSELYAFEIEQPGKIECDSSNIFNYNKSGMELYTTLKSSLMIDKAPPKTPFIIDLFKCILFNMTHKDMILNEKNKEIVELLLWLLDTDSEICVELWKKAISRFLMQMFPEMKQLFINAIKQRMFTGKHLKNVNVIEILDLFLNFITKKDQTLVNDIIVCMRYGFSTLPKQMVQDNIEVLQKLVDIKSKMGFENNSVFCICFIDLLKQEIFSVLPMLKYYIMKLSTQEKQEISKFSLQSLLNNLLENEAHSSDASSILKLLENTTPTTFFSRGAKIRNMVTTVKTPNDKKNLDLNELSDADFVKIDSEVFIDPKKMSEHQKEVASKRRDDIPALYEDLTQSSMDLELKLKANGLQEGEDKKRKREDDGSEVKSEDEPKIKKNKALDSVKKNNLLAKNVSTPISSRTQRMFERPLSTTKLKDKLQNMPIPISDVKVVLTKNSIQTKLDFKKNSPGNTSEDDKKTEGIAKTDEENQSKSIAVKNKPESSDNKEEIVDTLVNPSKERRKGDTDKTFSKLSTNKKDEPLDEDNEEADPNKVFKKKRGRPKKSLSNSSVESNNDSLQEIHHDTEEIEPVKDVNKKQRRRPKKSLNPFSQNTQEDDSINNTSHETNVAASKTEPSSPEKTSAKLPDTETEIIENTEDIENDENTDYPDEDNSKENVTSNSNSVNRVLEKLKMDIVGGNEFVNRSRRRTNSIYATKLAESKKNTTPDNKSNSIQDFQEANKNKDEKKKLNTKEDLQKVVKLKGRRSLGEIKGVLLKQKQQEAGGEAKGIVAGKNKLEEGNNLMVAEIKEGVSKTGEEIKSRIKDDLQKGEEVSVALENKLINETKVDEESTELKAGLQKDKKSAEEERLITETRDNLDKNKTSPESTSLQRGKISKADAKESPVNKNKTDESDAGTKETTNKTADVPVSEKTTRRRYVAKRLILDTLDLKKVTQNEDDEVDQVKVKGKKVKSSEDILKESPREKKMKTADDTTVMDTKNKLLNEGSMKENEIKTNEGDLREGGIDIKEGGAEKEMNIKGGGVEKNVNIKESGTENANNILEGGAEKKINIKEIRAENTNNIKGGCAEKKNNITGGGAGKKNNMKGGGAEKKNYIKVGGAEKNVNNKEGGVDNKNNIKEGEENKNDIMVGGEVKKIDIKEGRAENKNNTKEGGAQKKNNINEKLITGESKLNDDVKKNTSLKKIKVNERLEEQEKDEENNLIKEVTAEDAKVDKSKCDEETGSKTVIFDRNIGKIVRRHSVTKCEENHSEVNKPIPEDFEKGELNTVKDDTFTVTTRSDTKSGICLTIKKLSPVKLKNSIETPSEEDLCKFPSPNKMAEISPYPKLRVSLFRNNFDKLSPEKIKEISHLNEVSPVKEPDTETIVISSQDSDVRVSEVETESLNETGETSDVSLKLFLEKTPERIDSLVSSPVSHDTPSRNSELMNSTFDISPIKNDVKKPDTGKESPDLFSQKEPSQETVLKDLENDISFKDEPPSKQSKPETPEVPKLKAASTRSAKLLNLVPQAPPSLKIHRSILAPQVSSPTTERIKRMMMNCEEQNQAESMLQCEEPVVAPFIAGRDILKFEKEVPSPLATPKVSILKRKLPEVPEDGFSPCAKRKRVNFSDPPTTSEKIYFKEIEEKSHFRKMKRNKHKSHSHTGDDPKSSVLMFDDIRPLMEFTENGTDSGFFPFLRHEDVVQNASGSLGNGEDALKSFPKVLSATTEKINQMMLGFNERNVRENRDEERGDYEEEVQSPLATLKISIHKRNFSPSSKRKRVNFSDPPTTSEKIYFKEIEEKYVLRKGKKKLHCKITNQPSDDALIEGIKPLEEPPVVSSDTDRVFRFTGLDDPHAESESSKSAGIIKELDDAIQPKSDGSKVGDMCSCFSDAFKDLSEEMSILKMKMDEIFVNSAKDILKKNMSMDQLVILAAQLSKEYGSNK